ncbi:hypothetical protein [uncultured Croceitalea sp.]|uniref:hypothetical protein n=1 Tax=uncultured Croceitalea sp. TaxID=1798908 RepID=UPI003305A3E8
MMYTKKLNLVLALIVLCFSYSCKDNKIEQEALNKELEQIEAVEQTIDSTVTDVHKKAEEVKELLKELDSI